MARADRERGRRACRASPPRSPSASTADATSTSTSTARAAARYGLNVADVQDVIAAGGRRRERRRDGRRTAALPDQRALSARDCAIRSTTLRALPIVTERGRADPARRRRRRAHRRRSADAEERERAALGLGLRRHARVATCGRSVTDMQRAVARDVKLPPGYSIAWSGQFEYLERASARLERRRAGHARSSSSCCST